MRGQKLFNAIVKAETGDVNRRGRSDALVDLRNQCMLARYYYYGHLRGKCYEEILQMMAREFFLTPVRISRIIQQKVTAIKEMKDAQTTAYQLQLAWPQFKW